MSDNTKHKASKRTKSKRRTPVTYNPDVHPQMAYETMLLGATLEELAKVIGVSTSTVKKWKVLHESFAFKVERGRDEYDRENVEKSLLQRALGGYEVTERKEEVLLVNVGKNGSTRKVPGLKVTNVVKIKEPDVVACIFWLKNRDPGRWRDVQEKVEKGEVNHNHKHEHSGKVEIDDSYGRSSEVAKILSSSGAFEEAVLQESDTTAH